MLMISGKEYDDSELSTALQDCVQRVEAGEMSALKLARVCVFTGHLLVGSRTHQDVHYPVPSRHHHYYDIRAKENKYPVDTNTHALRATGIAELAIACGLFGGFNGQAHVGHWGYAFDRFKTLKMRSTIFSNGPNGAYAMHPSEVGAVRLHAEPWLINACRYAGSTIKGCIDVVGKDTPWTGKLEHDGSFITDKACKTVISIPLAGYDCPVDISPVRAKFSSPASYETWG